ncbi:phage tail protein [Lysinibacillus sphaericus]|uniref:phage tail protein n=1 Tax=Lysinibacillus sphaericus TaxID=1421 RepID=UPI003D7FB0BC
MAENFYTVLTNAGIAAFANAQVSQSKVDFSTIAVGDSNGTYYNPVANATKLVNEVWRGPINSISIDETNPNWVVVEAVIPATAGGFSVREIGVFDTAGVLLAIGKVPETYKPATAQGSLKDLYLRMILEVSNASAVTLKVDPAVIFASKKYVDDKVSSISQNTTQIIDKIGNTNNIEVENTKTIVEAVNKVNHTLIEHLEEIMPHKFFDNGKWYRWGFRTVDGEPEFIYEEVL